MAIAALLRRLYWTLYLALHLPGQARYPFRSAKRIARDRDRRASRMVAYAYRWTPYYRETFDRLGLKPQDFRTYDDLQKLPLISVADLQADPERFRSRQFGPEEVITLWSNGSTGRPHHLWHDLAALYQNAAHALREQALWRRAAGHWRLKRLGMDSSVGSTSIVRRATRANALWPRFVAGQRRHALKTEQDPAAWAETLAHARPDLLTAYGSMVTRLVAYAERGGAVAWPPLVRYTSDGIAPAVRRLLTERYGVTLFSGYQAIEAFKMGFECDQHNGYHVNDDLYPLRVVDGEGRDCPPGVEGELVLCNLVNRATVLLNYRMGDLAARLDAPCPCGRRLSRITFVQGRTNDMLTDQYGREVERIRLLGPVTHQPGVIEYQIHQTARDRVRIEYITAPSFERARAEAEIRAAAAEALGPDVQVTIAYVDAIARTGGKLRAVINEVPAR